MNIKALITMLVLGSSSVAMARPVTVSGSAQANWSYGTAPAPIVRDHRTPAPAPAFEGSYHRRHSRADEATGDNPDQTPTPKVPKDPKDPKDRDQGAASSRSVRQ